MHAFEPFGLRTKAIARNRDPVARQRNDKPFLAKGARSVASAKKQPRSLTGKFP
jgi:hypothetical protein